jgi:hypothetical protein
VRRRRRATARVDESPRPVSPVFAGASLEEVSDDNLGIVTAACARAGVEHAVTRFAAPARHAVFVDAADRARLLAALADEPGRVRVVAGRGGRPVRLSRVASDPDHEQVEELRGARSWRVFRRWSLPDSPVVLGAAFGCSVRFTEQQEVPAPIRPSDHVDVVAFPIDVVYTWVDDSDPRWQARREAALAALPEDDLHPAAVDASRFRNRDELRYSMRSVRMFAPWVRRIHLVTDGQVPAWLDLAHPDVRVVDHREIFDDPSVLPTFNSRAIESRLHDVPGLAVHFLYLNDDMFLGRPLSPRRFFHPNGIVKFFPSRWLIPEGAAGPGDDPVDSKFRNGRDVIRRRFGRTITQRVKHAPYANRLDVLRDMEREMPELFRSVASRRFRHWTDLSIASFLSQYYAYCAGVALPGSIRYLYVRLQATDCAQRLNLLRGRWSYDSFCLNDTVGPATNADLDAVVTDLLEGYFPLRAPWERDV